MPARLVSLLLFLFGLLLNEWAFELVFPGSRNVDAFNRLLVLVLDLFILDISSVLLLLGKGKTLGDVLRFIKNTFPRLTAIYIGIFTAYLMIVGMEFSCRVYFKYFYKAPYTEVTKWEPYSKIPNEKLGYKLPPDTSLRHQYIINDSLIYDYTYPIDSFSRRITPMPDSLLRNKFLIVSGCSFAFGYGVDNDQTLAARLGAEMPDYKPYNYGVAGYGTQQMMVKLQEGFKPKEIPEKSGVFIYFFIDDHVRRTVCSRYIVKLWGENFPSFELDDGKPVNSGPFKKAHPIKFWFYNALSQSAFIDLFQIDFPLWIRDKHLKLVANIIAESKKEFEVQFPGSKFYVLLAPGSKLSPRLIPFLKNLNIDFIDCSQLLNPKNPEYLTHYTDRHPNALYYKKLAKAVAQEIK